MPFPVDPQFIKQTEEQLGVIFPPSFKRCMSQLNGGDVRTVIGGWEEHWQLHPFFDTSDKTRLKRTCNDIVRETRKKAGLAFRLMRLPSEATVAVIC